MSQLAFCLVRVVRPAPELKIVGIRWATLRERDEVMELEESLFSAAAVPSDKGAPPFIAGPHGPLDGRRNMPPR